MEGQRANRLSFGIRLGVVSRVLVEPPSLYRESSALMFREARDSYIRHASD
jgi:hypothetical protein